MGANWAASFKVVNAKDETSRAASTRFEVWDGFFLFVTWVRSPGRTKGVFIKVDCGIPDAGERLEAKKVAFNVQ
jgi:hypothetical protein